MSVRYRLFVIVGALFTAIFVGSFFVESRLNVQGVTELKKDLSNFYKQTEKEKTKAMQRLVGAVFYRRLGEVNAALEVVSSFRRVKEFFAPTRENIEKGTWISAASLLQDRETIDFIQNAYDKSLTCSITARHEGLRDAMQEEIDDDLSLVFMEKNPKPFLGVALHLISEKDVVQSTDAVPGIVPKVFVLYNIERLQEVDIAAIQQHVAQNAQALSLSVPFMAGFRLDVSSFVNALGRAREYVIEEGPSLMDAAIAKSPLPSSVAPRGICTSQSCFLDERVSYVNQIYMIWQLCCLLETSILSLDTIDSPSPYAISFFPDDTGKGGGIYVDDVLRDALLFDGSTFFPHTGKDSSLIQTEKTALIHDETQGKLYLGNVAKLTAGNNEEQNIGYLTLGFDVENALKHLCTGYGQKTMILSQGKIVSYVDDFGIKQPRPSFGAEQIALLLSKNEGIIELEGVSNFYMHLIPIETVDLHIILFTKADEEFLLLRNLSAHFQDILDKISKQRQWVIIAGLIILLLALLDLSKKITRPVSMMAEAARTVLRSGLQSACIPKFNLGKRNEVQQLSVAFSEMIEGLKEKEKVKGILDKVVSHEIAGAILKGDIHLGGEDRVVTMFFADVRSFTHLTQNMLPHQVIDLVNTCMTKLAGVIDKHHGVIDKYIGDEVMVLFGAPIAHQDSAYQAVLCGIDVIDELKKWNEQREKEGLAAVTMGIGIHTGKVCAGNMGAENRMNYTVIGSNVNLASRLCSKALPSQILISEDTLLDPLVVKNILVEDMGYAELKGFDLPKKIYSVKGIRT